MVHLNWLRTCHPSFLHCWPFSKLGPLWQTSVGRGPSSIFWLPSISLRCFRFVLSHATQLANLGLWINFVGSSHGHILADVRRVLQSRLVSSLLPRKPIILKTIPLAISLLCHLIFFVTRLVWPCWRPWLVRWFADAPLSWWYVWFRDCCRI